MTSASSFAPYQSFKPFSILVFILIIFLNYFNVSSVPIPIQQSSISSQSIITPYPSSSNIQPNKRLHTNPTSLISTPSIDAKPSKEDITNQTKLNLEEPSSSLVFPLSSPSSSASNATTRENMIINKNQESDNKVKNTEKDSIAYHQDDISNNKSISTSQTSINLHPSKMTLSQMLAEARAQHKKIMNATGFGLVEFFEWMFVFILIAPGTFPVIGCVLLSCASFWRRRLAATNPNDNHITLPSSHHDLVTTALPNPTQTNIPRSPFPPAYQRTPTTDNGSFVVRARIKSSVVDARDTDVS